MQIAGEWWVCDDGATRPIVEARISGAEGRSHSERFLIDSGADRTVLSAVLLNRLRLPVKSPSPGLALAGIGGGSDFVLVTTMMELIRTDGAPARIRGEFAAFVDPTATDLSVLGRDVLDHFDVILSRRRNEVLLLAPNHQYLVRMV